MSVRREDRQQAVPEPEPTPEPTAPQEAQEPVLTASSTSPPVIAVAAPTTAVLSASSTYPPAAHVAPPLPPSSTQSTTRHSALLRSTQLQQHHSAPPEPSVAPALPNVTVDRFGTSRDEVVYMSLKLHNCTRSALYIGAMTAAYSHNEERQHGGEFHYLPYFQHFKVAPLCTVPIRPQPSVGIFPPQCALYANEGCQPSS